MNAENAFFGSYCHVVWIDADVSEEHINFKGRGLAELGSGRLEAERCPKCEVSQPAAKQASLRCNMERF
jgi:hypothetical protein